MHGLVSLLPSPCYEEVISLWEELETAHGLAGVQVTPFPHFSWQIAEDYDLDRLEVQMREIAQNTAAFEVRTAGLGIFTGPKPVVFIPIVKTSPLIQFHTLLWERTEGISKGRSLYYSPQYWIPHITLAFEDVDPANIAPVMSTLAFRSFAWTMEVDNLAFGYQPVGEVGTLKYQYDFAAHQS